MFDVGESAIKKEANPLLDAIAKALAKDATSNISIEVHSDDTAPDGDTTGAYLAKLTQKRADAVKTYFTRRGIPARRITAKGGANKHPLTENTSANGRRTNRRVEFLVQAEVRAPVASDLEVYMKGVKGTSRLEQLPAGGMCQYRVKLTSPAEVDAELMAWIRVAYDASA